VLLLERLQPEERKQAMKILRSRVLGEAGPLPEQARVSDSSRNVRRRTGEPAL
jgi:hypothetical protein